MQMIINIDDSIITDLKKKQNRTEIDNAILNGTPLPKGHGDLIDRDAINERYGDIYDSAINCANQPTYKYLLDKFSMCLDSAPAIIERDDS